MDIQSKVPHTYLENIDMLNSATQLINEKNNFLLLNSNININSNILQNNPKITNTLFYNMNNTNSFYKTKNDNSTNLQSPTQNELFNNYNNINTLNKLNTTHKFAWKEIMNNNYIFNNGNEFDNPLINNILNSNINENEIKNIPENYLINLINTLQGLANKAIENKNNLQVENEKLYNDLNEIKNNYDYIVKNNNKMNKNINELKKENNEQKNIIKNYQNNNYKYNNIYNIKLDNYFYKQKFHCKFCSNKIFKSKYYLEQHIQRRHPNNYENSKNIENLEQKKKHLENRLDQMKIYFEILINASIRKSQYMKLNEKLNGIQNLILMSKNQQRQNTNYINNYIDNYSNYNNFNNDNFNEDENVYVKENINNEDIYQKENNLKNQIKRLKNEMNHFFNKSKTELFEINREKHFQSIKNYFEKNQKRRDKKTKTIKATKLNYLNNANENELNISADEINTDLKESKTIIANIYQSQKKKENVHTLRTAKANESNKNIQNNLSNANTNNINNTLNKDDLKNSNIVFNNKIDSNKNINTKININDEHDNNNNNSRKESHRESDGSERYKNKQNEALSFGSEKNSYQDYSSPLEKFYDNFRERDGKFSKFNKRDYLTKIIDNNNVDEEKIKNIVEEKINKKLININFENNEDLISDILKLNYQILDQNFIYGDVYCYYSRNISMLMNTKELINEANNYYYNYNKGKNLKSIVDRSREANTNLFETVNYQIEKGVSSSYESEFSLKNN